MDNNKEKKLNSVSDGLIIVYTGDGKGKTSAAIGLTCRSAGWGKKIAFFQFIKGYKNIGEWRFFQRVNNVDFFQANDSKTPYIGKPDKSHHLYCQKLLAKAKKIIKKNDYDTVILDEINNAIFYRLVEVGEVIEILRQKPKKLNLVLTGRNVHPEIVKLADLVSEIKKIKHPYDQGFIAKKGIDF